MSGEQPDDELSRLAQYSAGQWNPKNDYFEKAEAWTAEVWAHHITPLLRGHNLWYTVDLAAGLGRHTERLRKLSKEVWVLDIREDLIVECRKRFEGAANVHCDVNSGFDLKPVPDDWATFIFSFDAMVHFDLDVVRSYLRDAMRVFKRGGVGLFHHSNYWIGGGDYKRNPQARNFMSAELFRHYAEKEGLKLVKQKIIEWGGYPEIDCISIVQKP